MFNSIKIRIKRIFELLKVSLKLIWVSPAVKFIPPKDKDK